MENKIRIGDKMFFLQLDSFVMKDQTKQIECRINEVTIKGIYDYEDEKTKYLFDIGDAKFHREETDLFNSEAEIISEAEKRIANIKINISLEENKIGPKQK